MTCREKCSLYWDPEFNPHQTHVKPKCCAVSLLSTQQKHCDLVYSDCKPLVGRYQVLSISYVPLLTSMLKEKRKKEVLD